MNNYNKKMNFKNIVFLIFIILSIAIMTTSAKTKNGINAKSEIELNNAKKGDISKEKLIADIKKKMARIADALKNKKN